MIYLSLYAAYISILLAWCILGAIISPEKFLPIATGAAVFIFFTYSIYSRLTKVHEDLQDAVGKIVEVEIGAIISNTFGKKIDKAQRKAEDSTKQVATKTLQRGINIFLSKHNFPNITAETAESIVDGDLQGVLNILHKCCGIHVNVSLALIGFIKEDPDLILESVQILAKELKLDSTLSTIICEILLDSFDLYSDRKNRIEGRILISTKKLFRITFPEFPIEAAETLLKVV